MLKKIPYKEIIYSEPYKDVLVFHLSESKFNNIEEVYILGLSQFIELVIHKNAKHIIFDKQNIEEEHNSYLHEYFKKQGIDELLKNGVKNIFFIVSEERYKTVGKTLGYKGIRAFTNFDECFKVLNESIK